jgi:hypothetical protein
MYARMPNRHVRPVPPVLFKKGLIVIRIPKREIEPKTIHERLRCPLRLRRKMAKRIRGVINKRTICSASAGLSNKPAKCTLGMKLNCEANQPGR